MPTKRPSAAALLIAFVPFVAMCFSVAIWDRVQPAFLGIPFNVSWLVLWMFLSSVCLGIAYRLETRRNGKGSAQ